MDAMQKLFTALGTWMTTCACNCEECATLQKAAEEFRDSCPDGCVFEFEYKPVPRVCVREAGHPEACQDAAGNYWYPEGGHVDAPKTISQVRDMLGPELSREDGWLAKQFDDAAQRVNEWPQWKKDAAAKEAQ